MIVSVVAGGWSFAEVDHFKVPGTVIAINDSLVYLHRKPDHVVSMDRRWTDHRWDVITGAQVETHIRRSVLKGQHPDPTWNWFHAFDNRNDNSPFSPVATQLNGASSGACGMNLAYTMMPKEVYLFGFDMCLNLLGNAYWYPTYQWSKKGKTTGYHAWPAHFEVYALQFIQAGCKVLNVSPHSRITSFRKVSAKDLGIAR